MSELDDLNKDIQNDLSNYSSELRLIIEDCDNKYYRVGEINTLVIDDKMYVVIEMGDEIREF